MSHVPNGELVPLGGGDSIPLVRSPMKVGRRDSCDICLRFPNISGMHSELSFVEGFWTISDLGSSNGTKVNGTRVQKKVLRPGDEISFANRRFRIDYKAQGDPNRHIVMEEEQEDVEDILNVPLLERAGLSRRRSDDDDDRPRRRPRQ